MVPCASQVRQVSNFAAHAAYYVSSKPSCWSSFQRLFSKCCMLPGLY